MSAAAIGNVIFGIGFLMVAGVITYGFWQLARTAKAEADKDVKYQFLEEKSIDAIAADKGIDLDKELAKRNAVSNSRKFRKRIQEEAVKKLFGDDKTANSKKQKK